MPQGKCPPVLSPDKQAIIPRRPRQISPFPGEEFPERGIPSRGVDEGESPCKCYTSPGILLVASGVFYPTIEEF